MHTSDTAKSDLNLAGLTLRCGRMGIEAVLVVLEPLSHQLRPLVVVKNGSQERQFESSVVQGGEAILLPQDASKLIASPEWQSAPELSVEIKTEPDPIRGTVPTGGLPAALQTLSQSCAVQ